jgi:hypothetical protein
MEVLSAWHHMYSCVSEQFSCYTSLTWLLSTQHSQPPGPPEGKAGSEQCTPTRARKDKGRGLPFECGPHAGWEYSIPRRLVARYNPGMSVFLASKKQRYATEQLEFTGWQVKHAGDQTALLWPAAANPP